MINQELKDAIRNYIGTVHIPDIACCEDSKNFYDAYNNVDSMYDHNKLESVSISIFKPYMTTVEDLAAKLDLEPIKLNDMFRFNQMPSKGLTLGIGLVLGLSLDEIKDILKKMSYHLGNDDFDKIVRYFYINDIRDANLLSEALVSFGCMYLYSKKKLR